MIILQLTPTPSPVEKEHIRQLVGYYRGIGILHESGILHIEPKKEFSLDSLLRTLQSMEFSVKKLSEKEG